LGNCKNRVKTYRSGASQERWVYHLLIWHRPGLFGRQRLEDE
jgi:hypothetical protein